MSLKINEYYHKYDKEPEGNLNLYIWNMKNVNLVAKVLVW